MIFSLSAAFGVYQIAANTAFVVRVPNERRAQAFGIASMGVIVGQGAAFVAAGAATEVFSPAAVIAVGRRDRCGGCVCTDTSGGVTCHHPAGVTRRDGVPVTPRPGGSVPLHGSG